MRVVPLIEPLEDRIAPAAVTISAGGKSASYQDTLGDTVTVTTTKGAFLASQFTFDPSATGQLTQLTLAGTSAFNGANITFSIVPVAGGTDMVNIGYIDALGLNLGTVTVPGDLGRIDVGGGPSPTALAKLTVNSLGAQGASTQGGISVPSTLSNITGTAGMINVAGTVFGAIFAADYKSKPGTGNITTLNIGGSLDGNTGTGTGEIFFSGALGKAVIGGGIEGGSGDFYGSIAGLYGSLSKIGSISVNGSVPDDPNPSPIAGLPGTSILGGAGRLTGGISASKIGTVSIAGDVFGGTGAASGEIQGGTSLSTVTIKGSLIGGNFASGTPSGANSSGVVFGGSIGSVLISKSIEGGSGLSSGELLSTGLIKSVTVMGDVAGGSAGQASTSGFSGIIQGDSLGTVTIGGSLIGGNLVNGDANQFGSDDGVIRSDSNIATLSIGKNIIGGSGPNSGEISTFIGNVGTLKIGGATSSDGSVIGGSGASSGSININGAVSRLSLTHSLTGGSGTSSGVISVNGALPSLLIGGSVTGGSADNTGTISAFGLLKTATIQGSVIGSSSGATKLTNTGYIQAAGIGSMTVGGALQAGTVGAGGIDTSGAIRSTASIGSITLGSILGNAANPAVISAVGTAALTGSPHSDLALGTVKVLGNATYANLLAGYNTDTSSSPLGTGVNADAQIGTVSIGGNLSGTNIIAGVAPGTGGFGTASSTALSGAGVADLPSLISKISKVVIAGSVIPTASNSDSFGIAAQYIASASVGGAKISLLSGPDNDTFAAGRQKQLPASTGDVFLYEV